MPHICALMYLFISFYVNPLAHSGHQKHQVQPGLCYSTFISGGHDHHTAFPSWKMSKHPNLLIQGRSRYHSRHDSRPSFRIVGNLKFSNLQLFIMITSMTKTQMNKFVWNYLIPDLAKKQQTHRLPFVDPSQFLWPFHFLQLLQLQVMNMKLQLQVMAQVNRIPFDAYHYDNAPLSVTACSRCRVNWWSTSRSWNFSKSLSLYLEWCWNMLDDGGWLGN